MEGISFRHPGVPRQQYECVSLEKRIDSDASEIGGSEELGWSVHQTHATQAILLVT
jgi:hypothetical protein